MISCYVGALVGQDMKLPFDLLTDRGRLNCSRELLDVTITYAVNDPLVSDSYCRRQFSLIDIQYILI